MKEERFIHGLLESMSLTHPVDFLEGDSSTAFLFVGMRFVARMRPGLPKVHL